MAPNNALHLPPELYLSPILHSQHMRQIPGARMLRR